MQNKNFSIVKGFSNLEGFCHFTSCLRHSLERASTIVWNTIFFYFLYLFRNLLFYSILNIFSHKNSSSFSYIERLLALNEQHWNDERVCHPETQSKDLLCLRLGDSSLRSEWQNFCSEWQNVFAKDLPLRSKNIPTNNFIW